MDFSFSYQDLKGSFIFPDLGRKMKDPDLQESSKDLAKNFEYLYTDLSNKTKDS